tara:strand:+ start:328 stop:597 length:270 start_codon:yes stop_codon:yes gene_type:complete
MNPEDAIKTLHKMDWHFAKSMPKIPHSYARRREWQDDDSFFAVCDCIMRHGKPERFYSRIYRYLYSDTHKYWLVENDIYQNILINRAEL